MASPIFLGLGGCIDLEVAVNADELVAYADSVGLTADDLRDDLPLTSERRLLGSFLSRMSAGAGGERFVESAQAALQLAGHFEPRLTLGGTAARAALALDRLGIGSQLHVASLTPQMRALLPDSVSVVAADTSDTLDPHLILQYPQGCAIPGTDSTAPTANRVIYVNDEPNTRLELAEGFHAVIAAARVILISSLNAMRDPRLLQRRLETIRTALQGRDPRSVVVFEDASYHAEELRHQVSAGLRGVIDLHSMNEEEYLRYLGAPLDLSDPQAVVTSLSALDELAMAETVIIHSHRWALARGPLAWQLRAVLEFGSSLATARYAFGDAVDWDRLEEAMSWPPSQPGVALAEAVVGVPDIVAVPAREINVAKPTTIGLGDTFIAGVIAQLSAAISEDP